MARRKTQTAPAAPLAPDDAAYRARLAAAKHLSTLQLLFRAARLLDEEALRRVASRPGRPRLRRSHTSLFPHLDLEGTRTTELAERMGISKQAVSQLVDELEAWGVLERVPDAADARAKLVRFTTRGRAGLLEGLEILTALEAELTQKIGGARARGLREGLIAALAHVDQTP